MLYVEQPLGPPLDRFLECLWLVWSTGPLRRRETQRVVPDGCPELIVHLEDPFSRWVDGRWQVQPLVFLAGTLTAPWRLRPGRRVRTLGVRFRPAAVRRFLAIDMKQAVHREVPFSEIEGQAAEDALLALLGRCRTTDRLFSTVASWLLTKLEVKGSGSEVLPSEAAVRSILAAKGACTIDRLAREIGCHRRSLERNFARDLGVTPKFLARVVRLNAVMATLSDDERGLGVDLALEMGFFDQSHLLRDARLLAGRRLSAAREVDGALARHFTDPVRLRQLLGDAFSGP
jgi:AraC-like DNA-binding protein